MLFLAIDHSGGPTNNNIYMLASVVPPGRSTTDVMFVRSTDDGATFSAPVKINDDPVNPSKWHWFGTFSVAPNGRLDAVWYDTRNAANNTDSQLFYSFSTDAGVTWSPNVAVSNAFNPFEGYPNQSKIGDYITMVSDETGGNVAYRLPSTSIRTTDSTKKMCITFGYSLVDRRPHRHQRQLCHRVLPQRLRLQLHLHLHRRRRPRLQLRRHRHQDLLLLPGLLLRQGGDLRRGRDLEFAVISDREHLAAMSEIVSLAPARFALRRRKYGGASSCEPRGSEDVRWASQSSALHGQNPLPSSLPRIRRYFSTTLRFWTRRAPARRGRFEQS